jgi:hypothetical protein
MTDYSAIDPILMEWGQKRVVHVYTRHQDSEVRTVMIADPSGRRSGLALDPIDDSGKVGIHAGRSDGWRLDRSVSLAELENALDEVYDAMMEGKAAPITMKIGTSQVRFWREQDGPRERTLKATLSALFEKEPNVRSAYLALMDYGEYTPPGVALCLDARVPDDKILIDKIGEIFHSKHTIILFLTGDQKDKLEKICPSFYRDSESSQTAK